MFIANTFTCDPVPSTFPLQFVITKWRGGGGGGEEEEVLVKARHMQWFKVDRG